MRRSRGCHSSVRPPGINRRVIWASSAFDLTIASHWAAKQSHSPLTCALGAWVPAGRFESRARNVCASPPHTELSFLSRSPTLGVWFQRH
jgi:hypothetical protein